MLIKHSVGLIFINVLETCTSISKRLNNMLWILKHDFFTFFFCTELAKVILLYTWYSNKRQIWNTASAWPNHWCSNFVHCLLLQHYMIIATPSGGIKGGHGAFPRVGGSLPTPPHSEGEKSAIFGEFVDFWPSESHFAPSMPRHKKKKIWCRHWPHHLVD